MEWLVEALKAIIAFLGAWATFKKDEQQKQQTEAANEEISKWADRPRSTDDVIKRLRERANAKDAS